MSSDHRSIVRRSITPQSASQPLSTPLYSAVAYTSDDPDALDRQYEGRDFGYTYAREGHPNASVLEQKIDWLEGASGGIVTGSGMSALTAVYLGLLNAGDHIVAGDQLYGQNLRLLTKELPRLGIKATLADPTDTGCVKAALKPETRMILVEIVANPTMRVADLEGIAELANETGVLLVVDNTFTTPAAIRPFEFGADIVMHSVTKLLAGHSDVTLGYVVSKDAAQNAAIRQAVTSWGLTPSPFDCWQAERGLHSFALRFEKAQANAKALATTLADHKLVRDVFYPGLTSHPDHNRASALIGQNSGNMLAFTIGSDRNLANQFIRAAKHIPFAPTLGDIATTLAHPASSSHRGLTPDAREAIGITEGFFRVSVGIEDPELICREFDEALEAVSS